MWVRASTWTKLDVVAGHVFLLVLVVLPWDSLTEHLIEFWSVVIVMIA